MTAATAVRRLLGDRADLAAHVDAHGTQPERLDLEEVEASGLTGRGGAAFPVHRKLAAMRPGGTVIANGSEGEPASWKDATLLARSPHLVIDGLLLAAQATRADRVVLAVKQGAVEAVRRALAERSDAPCVDLHIVAPGFLSGEATALVGGIAGRGALPADRVVRLTDSGLRRRPTLVQNVETLAHLALVARGGAAGFRASGTPSDPGTRLVTVSGDVAHRGVLEVAGGTPLMRALRPAEPGPVQAVLVGGYHGGWVGGGRLETALADADGPGRIRAGAGVLVVVGTRTCGLQTASGIVRWLADRSAGQCGPCVNGLPALASAFDRVVGGDRRAVAEVRRLAGMVTGSGACHHPDGTARMAAGALDVFAEDVAAHAAGGCVAT